MSKKSVGLLYDFDFQTRPGGAQRCVNRLVDAFNNHAEFADRADLVVCTPEAFSPDCDTYVMLLTKLFSDEQYEAVMKKPFVRYEMDYWRPFEQNSKWCDKLNEKAQLVIFGSPLHMQVYLDFIHPASVSPLVGGAKADIVAYCIDVEPYEEIRRAIASDPEIERAGTVWYGEWHWFKGPDIAQRWAMNNEQMLDMFSVSMPQGTRPNNDFVRLHGFAPEEDFFKIIGGFKKFIHFPRHPEPYPYSVLEAHLLGLEVEVSGRLGVESWGDGIDATIKRASTGAVDFWSKALEALNV